MPVPVASTRDTNAYLRNGPAGGSKVSDFLFPVGHPLPELGVVVFEPDDLGCARVG
jgi:hypothetical protein